MFNSFMVYMKYVRMHDPNCLYFEVLNNNSDNKKNTYTGQNFTVLRVMLSTKVLKGKQQG